MDDLNKICVRLLNFGYILILTDPNSFLLEKRYKVFSSLDKPALLENEVIELISRIKKTLYIR